VRSIAKPDMPDLSAFDVYSSGTSSNISIVPGAINYQTDYTYVLVPRKTGKLLIGPFTVEHKGKVYSTKSIEINVGQQAQQSQPAPAQPDTQRRSSRQAQAGEDFFIEQTVDNSSPYVGQQVTLIFRFYQAENLYEQPGLNWPDFKGFWTEDLPPNKTYNRNINGKNYRVTEIRRAIFPTVAGKLTIEPTVLTIPPNAFDNFFGGDPFSFFNRRQPRKQFVEKILRTKAITLNALQLPDQNKPTDFSGAVGYFTFNISIDQDTVEVDQPITLKAVLSGSGNIKKLPAITIPELQNFRLYDSGSNESIAKDNYQVSGFKSFEWVLIPTAPGEYEIPQLSFNYFNPVKKKYNSILKEPGKIFVKPSSIRSLALGDRPVNVIPAARTSLNYIITDLSADSQGQPIYKNIWIWLLQILPIGWLVFLSIFVNTRKKLEGDIAYARRKSATKAARRALKSARDGFGSPEKFYSNIYNGIVGFISDKLNVNAAGLTNAQIMQLLKDTGNGENLQTDFAEFLSQCDAGRFSLLKPDKSQMKAIYDKAELLLSELDRSLK